MSTIKIALLIDRVLQLHWLVNIYLLCMYLSWFVIKNKSLQISTQGFISTTGQVPCQILTSLSYQSRFVRILQFIVYTWLLSHSLRHCMTVNVSVFILNWLYNFNP